MKLVLSQEQQELRAAVRDFLRAASPLPKVRDGYDPQVYARLNGELGLSGLIVPEEYGGAGAGLSELAVALEETGAALLPGPFLATAFAALALTQVPDKELQSGIAEGRVAATLSTTELSLDGGAVSGTLAQVLSGSEADVLVAPARDGDAPVLVAVELAGPGVSRTALETLDLTRDQATIVLAGAPARVLGPAPESGVFERVCVALAAEQLGVMRAALDAIVAYAKIRVAFGRYIGSYQGVKHKLADMHCKLEQAESIVRYAAWAADESPEELPEAAALAQAYVGRACFEVARDHLLLHGGIGYTWEHDAHLFYKRAKADEVLLGPPRIHRARLAQLLEL
ncbi:Acyl-CoA dehydrogenase, C-terminal [[Actinomadura] parvosata subsp. kistnae]|uniref:Acyl-CoA dehydrogenase n=1 Tax=[Actinomadura] parvosata subsp. kistnae TaxID=1909395 RepID=A0A1U9ZQF2_9ACTN|nr:acyl-CoA dehydrogenase family protein [Nonomuraea sp. ATCC 55076]AQZ60166.1 acyl-CoA dehydrogenase [Nonomuraea sp. ATCC 55076]SPL91365.1 Acyl-CoA dehydrogenase, C-terminal [Actinomadura parvosata subsp. kistnae]